MTKLQELRARIIQCYEIGPLSKTSTDHLVKLVDELTAALDDDEVWWILLDGQGRVIGASRTKEEAHRNSSYVIGLQPDKFSSITDSSITDSSALAREMLARFDAAAAQICTGCQNGYPLTESGLHDDHGVIEPCQVPEPFRKALQLAHSPRYVNEKSFIVQEKRPK